MFFREARNFALGLGKIEAAEERRIRDLIASAESNPSAIAGESLRTSFSDAA
jgi:hypothetical protein